MSFVQRLKEICQKTIDEKEQLRTNDDITKCNLSKWFKNENFDQKLLTAAQQGKETLTVDLKLQEFNTFSNMELKECPINEFKEVFEETYPGLFVHPSRAFDCTFYIY